LVGVYHSVNIICYFFIHILLNSVRNATTIFNIKLKKKYIS